MPWGLEPRLYQLEAVETALKQNSIINLPTGTGKTLIAAMVADAMKGDGPALLTVPTQALMEQHTRFFADIGVRVFVRTAAAALQALQEGVLPPPHLAIFDEVHHCVKDHPYVAIAQFLKKEEEKTGKKCRILGLTASFLHGAFSKLQEKRTKLEEALEATITIPPSYEALPDMAPQYYKVDYLQLTDFPTEMQVNEWTDAILKPFMHLAPPQLRYMVVEEALRSAYTTYCTLGSMGWIAFLRHGLVPLVQQKLRQKAEYVVQSDFTPWQTP